MSNLPARQSGGSVVAVDLNNLNMDAIERSMRSIEERTGERPMQKGGNRLFPGQLYTFNQERGFLKGAGKKGEEIDPPRFVVNFAHMGVVWQRWGESASGKAYPIFSDLCIPAAGDDLVSRDSLGFTDPEGTGEEGEPGYEAPWALGSDKKPIDPWKLLVVFPVRNEITDDDSEPVYDHIQADNKTNRQLFYTFMRETAKEAALKPGMLPVVQFGIQKLSKPAVMKGKRVIQQGMEWEAMSMEIVDWTPAQPFDRLNQNVDLGEEAGEDSGDLPEAKVTQRALPPPPAPASKGKAAAPEKGKLAAERAPAAAPSKGKADAVPENGKLPAAPAKGKKKSAPADL